MNILGYPGRVGVDRSDAGGRRSVLDQQSSWPDFRPTGIVGSYPSSVDPRV